MTALVRIATHDADTVAAIHAALDARQPIALVHAKLPDAERARQAAAVETAPVHDGDAVVLFTSGSTGLARGVVLARDALAAAALASWEHLGHRPGDRWLCALSLAHAGGLSIVIRCRSAGVPCVLGDHRAIADDITLVSLVPAQLAELLDDAAWRPPPALRAVLLGGAAAAPSLVAAAIARGVPVLPSYGLTETFGQIATARVFGGPLVPLPGVTIRGGTRDAPATLRVRGPMLAARYLDGTPIAPELVTSDVGFIDAGELHVIGRADDVIITGAENVHPAQVEAVLAATPGVHAVIAFGVDDARWGQVVAAAITVEASFDREAAAAYWHAALPAFARPRRLAIVGALPHLPSGKLDRRAARSLPLTQIEY